MYPLCPVCWFISLLCVECMISFLALHCALRSLCPCAQLAVFDYGDCLCLLLYASRVLLAGPVHIVVLCNTGMSYQGRRLKVITRLAGPRDVCCHDCASITSCTRLHHWHNHLNHCTCTSWRHTSTSKPETQLHPSQYTTHESPHTINQRRALTWYRHEGLLATHIWPYKCCPLID